MPLLKKISSRTRSNFITYAMVIIAFIAVQAMLNGGRLSFTMQGQLVPVTAYIVMAVSLNLTVGIMGELSLGHAGFVSVGAFSGAITAVFLRTTETLTNVYALMGVSMAVGAVFAGFVGFLIGIPVLRLRGDFVALVTLAFGEIIRNVLSNLYVGMDNEGLRFGFLTSITDLHLGEGARTIVNGPMGLVQLPRISTFTMGFALVMFTLFIVFNLVNSRAGRAIMALRDNRIAAESIGIPVTKYKLTAFVTSAALAGMAGTLFVMNFSSMNAARFDFNMSILILVFVVLGGLRNMRGSIIAAAFLVLLPEMMRQFDRYRMLVYAVVLILVMLATNNQFIRGLLNKAAEMAAAPVKRLFKRKGEPENGG
jgi:branched-chain amino acid transport system permease protein